MTYPQRILTRRLNEIVALQQTIKTNTLDWRRVEKCRRETEQALNALALLSNITHADEQYSELNENK